ncbi:SIMPL domain-containing protein [bacterium LRH843]|nr:SIMPL domain-containing protein [bacterium LRH843]
MMKNKGVQIGGIMLGIIGLMFSFQLIPNQFSNESMSVEAMTNVQTGTLVVSSVGEVNAKPDIATVSLGAQATAASAIEAQTEVNKRLQAIRKALKELGVKDDQMKTAYFHVYPYQMPNPDGNANQQYQAEHVLEIEYKEIDRLGELIDAASKAGANQIQQIRFSLQNPEKIEHEALQIAIEKAAIKADVMAKSANKKRGEVLQISDQAAQVNFPFADAARFANTNEEAQSNSTAIESGEVKIIQRVDVVYQLQ